VETFGRYTVLRLAGEGGMAQVHIARQIGPGGFVKPCVLKRISKDHVEDEQVRKLFLEEARISALLSHRNVVQTFDFGEVGGVPFMAMELVDGVNLAQLLKAMAGNERWIALGPAVAVVRAVLEALDYAHGLRDLDRRPLNLVHRDVSPQNILLSRAGDVKLADFGIARHDARDEQTIGLQPKGKRGYMAPEQAVGGTIDGRADLFAIGVVLVELISAERVIEPGTVHGFAALPARMRELCAGREESPPELNAFALRLASLEVSDRPRSAREAIEQLEPIVPKLPPSLPLSEFLSRSFEKYFPAGAEPPVDDDPTDADGRSVFQGWPSEFAVISEKVPDLVLEKRAPGNASKEPKYELMSQASGVEAMQYFAPEVSEQAKRRGREEVDRAEPQAPPPQQKIDVEARSRMISMVQLGLGALVLGLFGLGIASLVAQRDEEVKVDPRGSVQVTSEPPGARILVEGRSTGKVTPALIEGLPADVDLAVAVRLERHRSVPRQAVVKIPSQLGRTSVAFKLRRGRVFRIESAPEGAQVEVDGERLHDITPLELETLPFGDTAQVTVKLVDHMTAHLSLAADAVTATVVAVKLEPAKEIDIVSSPEGAEVWLDGKKIGVTPVYDLAVPLDRSFRVLLKRAGFKQHRQRISGKKIVDRQLVVNMEPLPLLALPMTKEQRREAKILDGKMAALESRLRSRQRSLVTRERHLDQVQSTPGAFIADIAEAQRAVDLTRNEIESLEQAKAELSSEIEQFREELRQE
jgi:serine/threonine protein kinase